MISLMKRLAGTFLGKIVIVIIIAGMAFWGADAVFTQVRDGFASNLVVSGPRALDGATLDFRVENELRRINQESDRPMTKSEAAEQGTIDQIYQIEAERVIRLGYADTLGVSPSTDAVLQRIRSFPAFQNPLTGELDSLIMQDSLRRLGYTLRSFEREVQDDLALQALQQGALAGVVGPRLLSELEAIYLGENRSISWFFYQPLTGLPPDRPAREELEAYYNENLETLRQPERRGMDVLFMSLDDFTGEVEVTEQEITIIYEATKSERFSEADSRTFAELHFDSRDAARDAFGRLAGGADIESITRARNVTMRTARAAEVEDALLREAMFGAGRQSGAMFGPRETQAGWLVARLISVQPGAVRPLEEVEDQIRTELARDRAQVIFAEKIEALDSAIAAGLSVFEIAEEIGIPVMSLSPVDRQGMTESGIRIDTLQAAPGLVDQLFRLRTGDISSLIDTNDGVAVGSTRTIVASYTPDFDVIENDLREAYIFENRSTRAQSAADALTDRIRDGASTFQSEAAAISAEIETAPQPISRSNAQITGLPGPILQATFTAAEGDVLALPLGDGETFLILSVDSVTLPDEQSLESLLAEAQAGLTNNLAADIEMALSSEIRDFMRPQINEPGLADYKRSISTVQ